MSLGKGSPEAKANQAQETRALDFRKAECTTSPRKSTDYSVSTQEKGPETPTMKRR